MRGHKTTCHLQSGFFFFLLKAVHWLLQQLLVLLVLLAQVRLYYQELIFPSPVGTLAASVYKPPLTPNTLGVACGAMRGGEAGGDKC